MGDGRVDPRGGGGRAGRELSRAVHRAARAARGRNERLRRFFRAILEVYRPAFDDLLVPLGLVRRAVAGTASACGATGDNTSSPSTSPQAK